MYFANMREMRLETGKVFKKARGGGPVIVTQRGRPVAVLRAIDEQDLPDINRLWRNIRQSAERAGYKAKDVDRLIREVRAAK